METVQGPDVARVLQRAREGAVQAEVGPVDRFRLLDPSLFEEECAVGVPGGLHPAPRLVVGEVVVQFDGAFQGGEGDVVVALAVLQFAVEHRRGDREDVGAGVVEEHAGPGDPGCGLPEEPAFRLRLGDAVGRGEGDASRVVAHRRGHRVQLGVGGHRQGQDVVPAAEADQHVDPHGEEGLQPVGHGRARHTQQLFRDGRLQLGRGPEGDLALAEEHGAVDLEVVVVRAVQGVEVHRPGPGVELLVGRDRRGVVGDHSPVVAAEHLQVRGHVQEVPGVRHQAAQPVRDGQRRLGCRGHLHQVDVHVDHPRVLASGGGGEGGFEDGLGLRRACAFGRFARPEVPQLPGREVHKGVGVQGGDVRVVRGELVDRAHAVGVGGVPDRAVLDGLRLRVAGAQCGDQRLLDGGGAARLLVRQLDGRVGPVDGADQVLVVEEIPGFVVVRAERVRDAPVGHGTVGVGLGGRLEAGDGLLVVEGVRPRQAAVEPALCVGRGRGHGAGVGAKVVVLHGLSPACAAPGGPFPSLPESLGSRTDNAGSGGAVAGRPKVPSRRRSPPRGYPGLRRRDAPVPGAWGAGACRPGAGGGARGAFLLCRTRDGVRTR